MPTAYTVLPQAEVAWVKDGYLFEDPETHLENLIYAEDVPSLSNTDDLDSEVCVFDRGNVFGDHIVEMVTKQQAEGE